MHSDGRYLEQALAAWQAGSLDEVERLAGQAGEQALAWVLRGMVARRRGESDAAIAAYQHALQLDPRQADACNNLANVLKDLGRNEEALGYYRQALAITPSPATLANLGGTLHALGQLDAAITALAEAIAQAPDNADAHWDYALALLASGDYARGLAEYEWRWQRQQPAPRGLPGPAWQGESLGGRTILVYAEQGLGDTIQCLRFVPELVRRGARVMLEVQPELLGLAQRLAGVSVLLAQGEPIPPFDTHVALLSLPLHLAVRPASLVSQGQPWLTADPARAAYWAARLPQGGLRVGLVWAGNPRVRNDAVRSPRLAPLLPLFDLPGISLVLLQHGDGRRDLDGLSLPPHVLDWGSEARDLADTAAIMRSLDLVISSDTVTAHLAGALGVEGWIVLPWVPDWRWGMQGPSTPWYPRLRLFRQPRAGDWASVVAELGQALQVQRGTRPDRPVDDASLARIDQALRQMQAGRHAEAVAGAEQLVAEQADNGMGWMVLGVVRRAAGRLEAALQAYRRAETLLSGNPELFNNLGNLLVEMAQPAAAAQAYAQAMALRDDWPAPWMGRITALDAAGDDAAAARLVDTALARWPAEAGLLNARGKLRSDAGQYPAALADFDAALAAQPGHIEARYNRGVTLHQLERYAEAVANDRQLLAAQPEHVRGRYNLGLGLQQLGQLAEAEAQYRAALARQPDYHSASINLAAVLQLRDDVEGASQLYAEIAQRFPDDLACRVDAAHLAQKRCDWPALREVRRTLLLPALAWRGQGVAPSPFPFLSLPGEIDAAEQLQLARLHAHSLSRQIVPLPARALGPRPARLRIGYVSADFHNHATAHLMRGLFGRHDRSRFSVHAYSFGPDDGSEYRRRIAADCDAFVDLAAVGPAECARRIRADGIDVLIDLKGYTRDARPAVFAYRPAPLQLAWLGYPGSMGADFIDYVLGDAIVTPLSAQADYSERLALLPHCYQVNDDSQAIDPAPSRREAGLPEQGLVFCCFNAHYKLDEATWAIWMRLLQAVPGSVLWLMSGYPAAEANLRAAATAAGVEAARLVFAPKLGKAAHLGRQQLADLFLDTRWYGAHTTASDALWAGVPVLSCPGATFASRVGASLLTAVGLPELIMADWAQYEATALALAGDPARLAALRSKLASQRQQCALFDTAGFVRDLETTLDACWRDKAARDAA